MADVIKLASNSQRLSHPLLNSLSSSLNSCQRALPRSQSIVSVSDSCFVSPIVFRPRKQLGNFKNPFVTFWRVSKTLASGIRAKVLATVTETEQPKWWERNAGPNMVDIHSTQELLTALSEAGERLVVVEFYGTWCASCRALFPKLCRTAQEHPDILFLKVNFDENKPMCKSLNVKVLPYFHFYRGADGQLESFSCSLAKFQKIKDAIQQHNTDRCSIGPPKGLGDMNFEGLSSPKEKLPESSAT